MIIKTLDMQGAAIRDPRGDFTVRLGKDDPAITYEEFVLYYMCRCNSGYEHIDPDWQFGWWSKSDSIINSLWNKMAASKTHRIEIVHSWDEIFPKYKEELGEETIERLKGLSDKDLGPEGEIVNEGTR